MKSASEVNDLHEKVAVYWDFENIHIGRFTKDNNREIYFKNRFLPQPLLIDVALIVKFISGYGDINIHRAYADWSAGIRSYQDAFLDFSIELIQLFPRGPKAKNGADIKLCLDIVEDIALHPHIGTYVIISGDSDYIAVAQKIRQRGKRAIGIGVRGSTNEYWIKACNEFKYYDALEAKAVTTPTDQPPARQTAQRAASVSVSSALTTVAAAPLVSSLEALAPPARVANHSELLTRSKAILLEVMRRSLEESDGRPVPKASIRPKMLRLDPSFDPVTIGFSTFAKFLDACSDVVEVDKSESNHLVSLKG